MSEILTHSGKCKYLGLSYGIDIVHGLNNRVLQSDNAGEIYEARPGLTRIRIPLSALLAVVAELKNEEPIKTNATVNNSLTRLNSQRRIHKHFAARHRISEIVSAHPTESRGVISNGHPTITFTYALDRSFLRKKIKKFKQLRDAS